MGKRAKFQKVKSRSRNLDRLEGHLTEWMGMGILVMRLTPYQYRFFKDKQKIDYYPVSSRYHDITHNIRGFIEADDVYKLFT